MPTPSKGPRLGGSPAHERHILANLAQSLFEHGRIQTTETKAKRLRPYAEKLITTTKQGTLHARREVMKVIRDKDVVHKLFAEIGPSFASREGGYTRIIKTGPRKGDNAPMAIIELVDEETVSSAAGRVTRRAAGAGASGGNRSARVAASSGSSPATATTAADAPAEGSVVAGEAADSSSGATVVPEPAGPSQDPAEGAEAPGDADPADDGKAVPAPSQDPAEGGDTTK